MRRHPVTAEGARTEYESIVPRDKSPAFVWPKHCTRCEGTLFLPVTNDTGSVVQCRECGLNIRSAPKVDTTKDK